MKDIVPRGDNLFISQYIDFSAQFVADFFNCVIKIFHQIIIQNIYNLFMKLVLLVTIILTSCKNKQQPYSTMPRFRSYSTYLTNLPFTNLYELPINSNTLTLLLQPPPPPPYLFYGPSIPFLTQIVIIYLSHHNIQSSYEVNPQQKNNSYIITDNPQIYNIQGFFIDFYDLKNVKQMFSIHIEEMETRSQVIVSNQELKDDLPYFEKMTVQKRPQHPAVNVITKDDRMIQQIENGFLSKQDQTNFSNYRFRQHRSSKNNYYEEGEEEEEKQKSKDKGQQRCDGFRKMIGQKAQKNNQYDQDQDQEYENTQKTLPNTQIIQAKDLNIVIEKRKEIDFKYDPNLLGGDNVLILFSHNTCVIFDSDLASFLFDKSQPLKSNIENQVERVGFVEEDIRNIIKIAIQNQQYKQQFQEDKTYIIKEAYDITNIDLKQAMIDYRPVTNLVLANRLYAYYASQQVQLQANQNLLIHTQQPLYQLNETIESSKKNIFGQNIQQLQMAVGAPSIQPLQNLPFQHIQYVNVPSVSSVMVQNNQPQQVIQQHQIVHLPVQDHIMQSYVQQPQIINSSSIITQNDQISQVQNEIIQLKNYQTNLQNELQNFDKKLDRLLESPKKNQNNNQNQQNQKIENNQIIRQNPHDQNQDIINIIDQIQPYTA